MFRLFLFLCLLHIIKIKMYDIKKIIHANLVYKYGYSGKGVGVAILDSGIYPCKRISRHIKGFYDFVNQKEQMYDDYGHGTHVAGIIAADYGGSDWSGIANESDLYILKVLNQYGTGKTKIVLNALEWIKENANKKNIRIVNISMGYLEQDDKWEQNRLIYKIEELWDRGLIIVTAAGNLGPNKNSITVPGVSKKVITVGAIGRRYKKVEAYSSRGPTKQCIVKPEILAPGSNILSLNHVVYPQETVKSGTSMSTPIVSSACALLLEKENKLKPEDVKLKLYQTCERIKESNGSWGMLHVDKLLDFY